MQSTVGTGQQAGVPPPPPPPPAQSQQQQMGSKPSASISQPAQRYDYSSAMQNSNQTGYDAATTYATGMMNMQQQQPYQQQNNNNNNKTPQQAKWNSMLAAVGGGMKQKTQSNQFNRNRSNRNSSGQPVQIFYCEVCKISCAGPQTYKEHLDGQKHKKREQASKLSNEQQLNAAAAAATTSAVSTTTTNTSNQNNWKQQQQRGRNQSYSRNSIVIKCELCDVACTGKDAYTAHVRGMKHQKTLKLHQKLGKPIPPDALDILQAAANVTKTVTPTMTMSAPVTYPQPNIITTGPIVTKPPVVTAVAPVSGTATTQLPQALLPVLSTTLISTPKVNEALMPEESNYNNNNNNHHMDDQDEQMNIEPIGREYIETRLEGKILSFYCKLCECQFNDPNAKDMHTKGRRHRLAYKKKVDPNLRVDMKSSSSNNSRLKTNRRIPVSHSTSSQLATSTTDTTTNSGGIMPLMSAIPLADGTQLPAQQTIQQLMSQPLK